MTLIFEFINMHDIDLLLYQRAWHLIFRMGQKCRYLLQSKKLIMSSCFMVIVMFHCLTQFLGYSKFKYAWPWPCPFEWAKIRYKYNNQSPYTTVLYDSDSSLSISITVCKIITNYVWISHLYSMRIFDLQKGQRLRSTVKVNG